jgi:hypothetical protein
VDVGSIPAGRTSDRKSQLLGFCAGIERLVLFCNQNHQSRAVSEITLPGAPVTEKANFLVFVQESKDWCYFVIKITSHAQSARLPCWARDIFQQKNTCDRTDPPPIRQTCKV